MTENVATTTISISPTLRDAIRIEKAESGESYDKWLRRHLKVDLSTE
jgi:hypothetical protein